MGHQSRLRAQVKAVRNPNEITTENGMQEATVEVTDALIQKLTAIRPGWCARPLRLAQANNVRYSPILNTLWR